MSEIGSKNPFLYPSVGGSPGSSPTRQPEQAPDPAGTGASQSADSFSQILGSELSRPVVEPLKFSAHAAARVQSRKIDVSPDQMRKINEAVTKAEAKGLDDTLILTKDSAFIVSVKNRTIVTAMDRSGMDGNVFTNIEGAVII